MVDKEPEAETKGHSLCSSCEELRNNIIGALDRHSEFCIFNTENGGQHALDHATRQYCSCSSVTRFGPLTYEGHRYKSSTQTLSSLTCQLCVFIWMSAEKVYQRVGHVKSDMELADQSTDDSIDFKIRLCAPYDTCDFSIDGGGSISFRFYEILATLPTVGPFAERYGRSHGIVNDTESKSNCPKWSLIPSRETHHDFEAYCHFISHRIRVCQTQHRDCFRPPATTLPSRLLELRGSIETPQVRLMETKHVLAQPMYAALSYCWGANQTMTTLQSNYEQYLISIDITQASRTITDAIRVAMGIGISYLWVDALCIVQDSKPDMTLELSRMAEVYTGAVCTLSIASAKSSADGFLTPGTTNDLLTIQLDQSKQLLIEYCPVRYENLVDQPLHTRGWTLQETVLSPTLVTIPSDGSAWHFRCKTEACNTNGGKIVRVPRILEYGSSTAPSDGDFIDDSQMPWHDIVTEYSKRHLGFVADKLAALSAIASDYEQKFDIGPYMAGIFSKGFAWNLLWRSTPWQHRDAWALARAEVKPPRRAATSWIAPSWSWASRAHHVYYDLLTTCSRNYGADKKSDILLADIEPESALVPNGTLRSASITMRCWSWKKEFQFIYEDDMDDYPCTLDTNNEIWFLHLAEEEDYNNPHSIGLILQEVDGTVAEVNRLDNRPVYKRIGCYRDGPTTYFETLTDDKNPLDIQKRVFTII